MPACGQHADARQAHSGCGGGSLAHHVDDGDAQGALQFVEEAVGRVAGQRQKIAAAGFQKLTVLDKRCEGRAVASPQQECRAIGDGRVVEGKGAHVVLVAAGLGALDEPLQEVGRGRRSGCLRARLPRARS